MKIEEYIFVSESDTTAHQETLFAVGFAIRQMRGGINREMILDDVLFSEAFNRYVNVGRYPSMESVYSFAHTYPSWVESVVMGCNALAKVPLIKGRFDIYRGSGVMQDVYDMKKRLLIKENITIHDDKWNPSDIWLSKIKKIPSFNNIEEFNGFIRKNLMSGELIGVSLKKSSNPRVYHIKQGDEIKEYKFTGIRKPRSPFNTGITIQLSDPNTTINVRSFSIRDKDSITTEIQIKGSEARHGKADPKKIFDEYKIPQTSQQKIGKMNEEGLASMVIGLWKNIGYGYTPKESLAHIEKKRREGYTDFVGYFSSIINSLEFGVYLTKNKSHADKIVSRLVREASSRSDISSDFLKIM